MITTEELTTKINDFERRFEDHRHTGMDSKVIKVIETIPFASDTLVISAPTERNTASTTYIKMKEIQVNMTGTIRIKFDLAKNNGTASVQGSLRRNEEQIYEVGSTQNRSLGWQTFTYSSLSVSAGDRISLYILGVNNIDTTVYTQSFNIYYTYIASPVVNLD